MAEQLSFPTRPSRQQLLHVIGMIQNMAGEAQAAYYNDRAMDRADRLQPKLKGIFDLCLAALAHDPPDQLDSPACRCEVCQVLERVFGGSAVAPAVSSEPKRAPGRRDPTRKLPRQRRSSKSKG